MNDITFTNASKPIFSPGAKRLPFEINPESHFKAGDILRVGRFEDNQYFCTIEVLSVSPIMIILTEQHAQLRKIWSLSELREVIKTIYPNESEFWVIEFGSN